MKKLNRDSLWNLEQYAERRADFRAQVIEHKKNRQVHLGDHATLYFEDALTIRYQVQEMLRVERIFEAEGIQEELDAYNPLIPDGCNWKATFMIEYGDVAERREQLARLTGVEHKVWAQVGKHERAYAIANEDLDRSTEEKTSAVHFMRFELTPSMVAAMAAGAALRAGIDHPGYPIEAFEVEPAIRDSLAADLETRSLN